MGQRAAVLYWLDLAFSLLYVGPVTVLYWRGTFNILNTLAFQGKIVYKGYKRKHWDTRLYCVLLLSRLDMCRSES